MFITCKTNNNPTDVRKDEFKIIEKVSEQLQYALLLRNETTETKVFPRSIDDSGEIRFVESKDWTSGFYPGILWLMYEITGDNIWKIEATKFTSLLEPEKFNDSNHDIGFKMMSSFGNGYRLTGKKEYREILIQSARTLITRFNENVGCIRSWDHHADKWEYPVIIDNMMNLELLFFAWRETGEPVFYNIAVEHAKTTMKNHFRNDFSSWHVVSYDPQTGNVTAKNTHQGFSDESCWSRGQAWALYGYTMVYRETKNPEFLVQAEKIADYILIQPGMKEGKIPYWDFNAPNIPNEPYDASAGAIISSAFFELSNYSKNSEIYTMTAEKLFETLSSSEFMAALHENKGFILKHSTGSNPSETEINVPLIYADYYYLEALKRKMKMDKSFHKLVNN
jgi:prophage maintenance system killer protein